MKNSVSKTLLALALTTASAAFVFSSANADQGVALTGKASTRIAVIDKKDEKSRQIVIEERNEKADELEIAPVAKLERPPISQKIVVVDKGEELEKTPPQQEIIEEEPNDIVEKVEKSPEIVDEDVFAPQVKKKTVKVEMPTIFTAKQQRLFNALSDEDQTTLVKSLIKKYGYETLYPTDVASNNTKTYSNYHSPRKYRDSYDNSYNNNYHSSNDNGYRYSNQSSYSNSYSNHSTGCAR